jgi:hypothetical protein
MVQEAIAISLLWRGLFTLSVVKGSLLLFELPKKKIRSPPFTTTFRVKSLRY